MKYVLLLSVLFCSCAEKKVPCDFGQWHGKDSAAVYCTAHLNIIYFPIATNKFQDIVVWSNKETCLESVDVDAVKYRPRKLIVEPAKKKNSVDIILDNSSGNNIEATQSGNHNLIIVNGDTIIKK